MLIVSCNLPFRPRTDGAMEASTFSELSRIRMNTEWSPRRGPSEEGARNGLHKKPKLKEKQAPFLVQTKISTQKLRLIVQHQNSL